MKDFYEDFSGVSGVKEMKEIKEGIKKGEIKSFIFS